MDTKYMLPVGTLLNGGRYKIVKHLSSGGFGKTYVVEKVFHKGELYAIKEFFIKGINARHENTVIVSNDENEETFNHQKEKFLTEAERLRDVENEHIVRVHDFFSDNGTCYYVMDLIDGESLNTVKKPLKEEKVWDILNQALDALSTIHQKKTIENKKERIWVHLDIKPANLMVDKNGKITFIDFGASKQLSAKDSNSSISMSQISFTKGYAPIEQTSQRVDSIGPWTDFYALGATLYKLLTEKDSDIPEYSELNDLLYANEDITQAFSFPKNVSEKMRKLIVWMMNPDRKKRPQSVEEVRAFMDGSYDEGEKKKPEEESEVTVIGNVQNSNSKETSTFSAIKTVVKIIKSKIQYLTKSKNGKSKFYFIVVCTILIGSAICIIFSNAINNDSLYPNNTAPELVVTNEIVKDAKRIDSIVQNQMIIRDTTKLYKSDPFRSELGIYCYYGRYDEDGLPNDNLGEARFIDPGNDPNGMILRYDQKWNSFVGRKYPDRPHDVPDSIYIPLGSRMYRGPFVHGKMEGENAVYRTAYGIFEGEFRDDSPYKGMFIRHDNNIFIGLFKNKYYLEITPYKGCWYDKYGNKK